MKLTAETNPSLTGQTINSPDGSPLLSRTPQREYRRLIQWSISHKQYNTKAKDEFANEDKADAWLVAHAIDGQYTVVTEEVFNPDIQRKIPIPECLYRI